MKKRNVKLFIDILMATILLCLMNITVTGLLLHKILGVIMLILLVIHIVLNFCGVKKVTLRFLDKTYSMKSKVSYLLYILLGILFLTAIVTGKHILITSGEKVKIFTIAHKISAVLTFIGISIHVGLHWNKIIHGFKCMMKIRGKSNKK